MHVLAQGGQQWDELTAIGTLTLAFFTFAAVIVSVVIAVTDRRSATEERTTAIARDDELRRADAAALEKRLAEERRQRADADARQVTVEFLPGGPLSQPGRAVTTGDGITHRIIVTAPASYQIKGVDARMILRSNSGLSTFGTGWGFVAPEFAGGLVRWQCNVTLNSQQRGATPIVRFTDPNGWLYHWYQGHTMRSGQNTDFHEAAAEIGQWIGRGPEPDQP